VKEYHNKNTAISLFMQTLPYIVSYTIKVYTTEYYKIQMFEHKKFNKITKGTQIWTQVVKIKNVHWYLVVIIITKLNITVGIDVPSYYQNCWSSSSLTSIESFCSFGDPMNMSKKAEITRLLLHLQREPIFTHIFPLGHLRYRQQFACGRVAISDTICNAIRHMSR
jgi:hypothetical protein